MPASTATPRQSYRSKLFEHRARRTGTSYCSTNTPAPEGRTSLAQGSALGEVEEAIEVPEGRPSSHPHSGGPALSEVEGGDHDWPSFCRERALCQTPAA